MGQGILTTGSDPKTTYHKTAAGTRIEDTTVTRREGSDDCKWKNCHQAHQNKEAGGGGELKSGDSQDRTQKFRKQKKTRANNKVPTGEKQHLRFLYTNANSLRGKVQELQDRVDHGEYDVVGVVETWLSTDILDSEIRLEGYDIFRVDRANNRMGGGVVLYVKEELRANAADGINTVDFQEAV